MTPAKLLLTLAILHAAAPAMADTLYVNNDTAQPADYRSFADAYAAASPGDTIMLAGSQLSYGNIAIVGKPIKLVGNGSSLITDYPQLHPRRADRLPTTIGWLYIGLQEYTNFSGDGSAAVNADGTEVSGINSTDIFCWSKLCSITSCKTNSITLYGSNNVISQSQMTSVDSRYNDGSTPTFYATGNLFRNCLIGSAVTALSTSSSFVHCVLDFSSSGETVQGLNNFGAGSTTLRHCIIGNIPSGNGYSSGRVNSGFYANAVLHYCLIAGTTNVIPAHSAANGNLTITDVAGVFDPGFQLQAGSAAIGAGENGEDLGIFGGTTPFEWGGVPAIPLIQKLDILAADPTTGLSFRVKAEARD